MQLSADALDVFVRSRRLGSYARRHHVGLLALSLALAGTTAYAADRIRAGDIAKNAVRGKHVKPDSLTGADLKERSLDPSTLPAGPEGPRGPEGPAGIAGRRGPVGPPGPATGAAGGDLSGNYPSPSLRPPAETVAVRDLAEDESNCTSTSATPGVFCGYRDDDKESSMWRNGSYGNHAAAGYYIDRGGRVHLRGLVEAVDAIDALPRVIFYLPPGFRPQEARMFAALGSGTVSDGSFEDGVIMRIDVDPDGAVRTAESANPEEFDVYLSLEGISFRAD